MTSHSEKQDLREEADTWKPCPVQCPNYSFPGSCSCDNESPRPRYKLPSKAYREALENDAPIKRTLASPDPRDERIAQLERLAKDCVLRLVVAGATGDASCAKRQLDAIMGRE